MITQDEAVQWSRDEAKRLVDRSKEHDPRDIATVARPMAAAALDFLQRQAPGSGFATAAHLIFEDKRIPSAPLALRRLAGILEDWGDVRRGRPR